MGDEEFGCNSLYLPDSDLNAEDPNLKDKRSFFEKKWNDLSVLSEKGYIFSLYLHLAAKAQQILDRPNNVVRAIHFLSHLKNQSSLNLNFAEKALAVLEKTNTQQQNVVGELLTMIRDNYDIVPETDLIKIAANWIENDSQLRPDSLRLFFTFIKSESEETLDFVKEEASKAILEGRIDPNDCGRHYYGIIQRAGGRMMANFGSIFYSSDKFLELMRRGHPYWAKSFFQLRTDSDIEIDTELLEKLPESLKRANTPYKISGFQYNCPFQALSVALSDYKTSKFDIEYRMRTVYEMIEHWSSYSQQLFRSDEQPMAVHKVLHSIRRFNTFYCRFLKAVPDALEIGLELYMQQRANRPQTPTFDHIGVLAPREAQQQEALRTVTLLATNETHQRDNMLLHLSPLKRNSVQNQGEQPSNLRTLLDYDADCGGSNFEKEVSNTELNPMSKFNFDWQAYRRALDNFGSPSAADRDLPMSIYGEDTVFMREELDELVQLMQSNPSMAPELTATAENLKLEIARLESLRESQKLQSEQLNGNQKAKLLERDSDYESICTVESHLPKERDFNREDRSSEESRQNKAETITRAVSEKMYTKLQSSFQLSVQKVSEVTEKVSASISHAFLCMQADAIAYALRAACDVRKRRDDLLLERLQDIVQLIPSSSNNCSGRNTASSWLVGGDDDFGKKPRGAKKAVKIKKSLSAVMRKVGDLMREISRKTKNLLRFHTHYRVDNMKTHKMVRNLREIDRGSVRHVSKYQNDSPNSGSVYHHAGSLYVFNDVSPGGKVYRAPFPASSRREVEDSKVVFDGSAGSFVKALTFIDQVGLTALLCVPLKRRGPNQSEYKLQVQVVDSLGETARRVDLGLAPLCAGDVTYFYTISAIRSRETFMVDGRYGKVAVLRWSEEDLQSVFSTWRQIVKRGARLNCFAFNAKCAHAMVTYDQRGAIFWVDSDARLRKRSTFRMRDSNYSTCAVSNDGLCFVLSTSVVTLSSTIALYDLDGNALEFALASSLVEWRANFALVETALKDELTFLFCSMGGKALHYVRLRSEPGGPIRSERIKLAADYKRVKNAKSEGSSKMVSYIELVIDRQFQVRMVDDTQLPLLTSVAETSSAFFVLDAANNCIKRFESRGETRQNGVSFRPGCANGEATCNRLTGMCVLDYCTLMMVINNRVLEAVDCLKPANRLFSCRFADEQTLRSADVANRSFVLAAAKDRLYVAVSYKKEVHEFELDSQAASLKVAMKHVFDEERILFFDFGRKLRRFVFLLISNNQHRVAIFDQDFQSVAATHLPVQFTALGCLLRGNFCFVDCMNNAKSFQLVYDAVNFDLLQCIPVRESSPSRLLITLPHSTTDWEEWQIVLFRSVIFKSHQPLCLKQRNPMDRFI